MLLLLASLMLDVNGIRLAPAEPARVGAPAISSPSVYGCSPERPVLWRIPVRGARPMAFSADGLPPGLALDAVAGVVTGAVARAGEYPVVVTVRNGSGEDRKAVRLVVSEDALFLTPLMGWTSWNAFGENVSASNVLETARLLDETGLADCGYTIVNVDSNWQGAYGQGGFVIPNAKFPDMRGLVAAIHARGLKAGIYSSPMLYCWGGDNLPGTTLPPADPRFASNVGSVHRERENAAMWAEWGFDYLKYDWMHCDVENAQRMKDALRATGRDIAFCCTVDAGLKDAAWWRANCTSWRDNEDATGAWKSVRKRFNVREKNKAGELRDIDEWLPYVGPGHFFVRQ